MTAVASVVKKRRIIFLNRFFFWDHSATSQMLTDLAFHLTDAGREIHVVTSQQKYDEPKVRLFTGNAFIESFNGKFRAECLNAHWFMSLDKRGENARLGRRDYNEERPHSAIGNKAPIELIDHGPRPELA